MESINQIDAGLYVEQTNVMDVLNLQENIDVSPALKITLIKLYQNLNKMNIALNLKDGGYITSTEFLNGPKLYFNSQQESQTFKCLVIFGALPNATSISVPHNIDISNTYQFFSINGASNNQSTMQSIPVPFSSPILNENISVSVGPKYVTVTTAIDYSQYTNTFFVLEYIKS